MESVDIPEELGEERVSGGRSAAALSGRARARAIVLAGLAGAALPLVGLVSLLLRSRLDPHFENYRLHFLVFGLVGAVAFSLGYAAGEAANRRGDARVLLLSLAFMATGGFLGLHALGTQGILFSEELSGFQVAIPVGLLVSAVFAAGSAFVDLRPGIAPLLIRRRTLLRVAVLIAMGVWFVWTVAEMPPLRGQGGEAATDGVLAVMAVVGTVVYALSAAPVLAHLPSRLEPAAGGRHRLLPAAVRGDDRRRGHGGAQVARELVGVARPDHHGIRDHRRCRTARMARRALPASLPANDA